MGGWHEAPDSPEAQLVGGPIRERVNVVHMANPITYVQPAAPPFLLMHGECDEIVPIAQSELLAHALRAAGNAVTLIAIPDAGHNFGEDEASWAEAQRQVVAFFRKELQL